MQSSGAPHLTVKTINFSPFFLYMRNILKGEQKQKQKKKKNLGRFVKWLKSHFVTLMFMCPCITSVIINDDQQDKIILDLFISSLLYMFRAIPSPIVRST
jgi:hypothetical protein